MLNWRVASLLHDEQEAKKADRTAYDVRCRGAEDHNRQAATSVERSRAHFVLTVYILLSFDE